MNEVTTPEDFASDDSPAICPACVDGRGYRWPSAANMRTDHLYVERCDECDRFADDTEAQQFIVRKIGEMWGDSVVIKAGAAPVGGMSDQPYIDILDGRSRLFRQFANQ